MIIHWLHPPFLGCWNMLKPHLSAPLHQALRLHQAQGRLRRFRRRHLRHGLLVDSYCVYIYVHHISTCQIFTCSVCLSIYLSIDRSIDRNATTWPSWGAFQLGAHQKWASRHPRGSFLWRLGCNRHPPGGEMLNSLKIDFSRKIQEDSGSLVSKLQ